MILKTIEHYTKSNLKNLFAESKELEKEIENNLKGLGYE